MNEKEDEKEKDCNSCLFYDVKTVHQKCYACGYVEAYDQWEPIEREDENSGLYARI